MDNIRDKQEAERFLRRCRLMIEESVVREVVRSLQGLSGRSKYDLWASGSRADGTTRLPICGKGTVDKIDRLLQKGALQPYIAFLEKGYSGDSKTVSPEESGGPGNTGFHNKISSRSKSTKSLSLTESLVRLRACPGTAVAQMQSIVI